MADLEDGTREALLTAIKRCAENNATSAELEKLGLAFALTVGANRHRLPGVPSSS
jgi:hypothetical protein